MAVVLSLECGAVIDHEAWMLQLLDQHNFYHHQKRALNFQGLFDIRTPFLMDGQAQKIAERLEGKREETLEPKRKKKKKELTSKTSPQKDAETNHILDTLSALQSTSEFKAAFTYTPTPSDYRMNNIKVRNLRTQLMEASNVTLARLDGATGDGGFSTKVVCGAKYILPPHTRYICDDVANILSHTSGKRFDLVVMDPPWHNKHVRRKKSVHGSQQGYSMMNVKDILKIPVDHLVKNGGLVAVWSTSNPSHMQGFLHSLHTWGVEHIATWYWLKVTKAGEPIALQEGSSHSKLPYERVFIAQRGKTGECPEDIPDKFVFCSIPSGIHSHKPPLYQLLKRFLVPEPRCLELFARNLVPGWTSIGLEVLRLQHSHFFDDLEDCSAVYNVQ
ncbi:DNA N6-methyl methyltransferase-like isoform X2 [Portunus trituberculatus]|nr:DNA N6-methyl methyltransferase-like isoform X2 [Portunus trituberculatus]XP_045130147.1 DNA N6-methyl methyltransferase-like isoform X2 [Portunus trituberculatus]XP_045130148.1 DNA N6-methyl methyltransferase-like isoform X2 [Portunus trituberculatus]XP_045130149.1 DNA N6-methyl methyltransferase-like isoform X2 [Portunus trituberculatus]XP_045130151.1 DNA N6-methyl methyltransferase-like isoform X2 [Portunus trituberculatus]XP_045130152.1 DNA N6-methyl methyltransferase-like isoform X2 [P